MPRPSFVFSWAHRQAKRRRGRLGIQYHVVVPAAEREHVGASHVHVVAPVHLLRKLGVVRIARVDAEHPCPAPDLVCFNLVCFA